jgi:hypothetical protein
VRGIMMVHIPGRNTTGLGDSGQKTPQERAGLGDAPKRHDSPAGGVSTTTERAPTGLTALILRFEESSSLGQWLPKDG